MTEREPSLETEESSLLTLRTLHKKALQYFIENQMPNGLILDRQANHGPQRGEGLCSTAATGMGLIALAIATEEPHKLLTPNDAQLRISTAIHTALHTLPHDHGIMPHFIDAKTNIPHGDRYLSTIDSSWFMTGALWAAAFLKNPELQQKAMNLYERVNWRYWSSGNPPILYHGKKAGDFIKCCWDRLNGETAFMYLLAIGAEEGRALPPETWTALKPYTGNIQGITFGSADLGLFAHQYSIELLDFQDSSLPGPDLLEQSKKATEANILTCQHLASIFRTHQLFWGLSTGDGPGDGQEQDSYREYAPDGICDGTAHITATIASIACNLQAVLKNIAAVELHPTLLGHYGVSNVNLDRDWKSRDVVGIDIGATFLALENFFEENRIRSTFHTLPCIQRALSHLTMR